MKTTHYKKFTVLCMVFFFLCTGSIHAQFGYYHPRARVVVGFYGGGYYRPHPRPYRYWRPAYVYHPYWNAGFAYQRRWVYFPGYNFYWDNRRNVYLFWNGGAWITAATPPPVVVNVNLAREKSYQLPPDDDDVDDVYRSNNQHQAEYKTK